MNTEKHFRLHRDWTQHADYTVSKAGALGWEEPDVGEQSLNALAVGETLVDEDGDTWERIA